MKSKYFKIINGTSITSALLRLVTVAGLLLGLMSVSIGAPKSSARVGLAKDSFEGRSELIPAELAKRMIGVSWHEGCPVPITSLRLLHIKHHSFDGKTKSGNLVVHEKLATEVLDIFGDLYRGGFLIEKMQTIEDYSGSDAQSMDANNTSSFNCRVNTTTGTGFSKHSYGLAIDINPIQNPYSKPEIDLVGKLLIPIDGRFDPPRIEPNAGRAYLDRRVVRPGMILKEDFAYRAFTNRGWTWGGSFRGRTDYQHFEK